MPPSKAHAAALLRWETQEGLPVHRHAHDKLGTVYSYKAELDDWWENGRGRLEALEHQEKTKAPTRRRGPGLHKAVLVFIALTLLSLVIESALRMAGIPLI